MHKSDHKKITDYVISKYGSRLSSAFQKLLQDKNTDILNGTEFEDMPFRGMGIKRAFHWHFYSPAGSTYPEKFSLIGLIKVHPTSREIYKYHMNRFTKWISKSRMDKAMETLGRIIHHIQDMSTPAHITPIYHGPAFVPMPYSFPTVHDKFEEYSSKNIDKHLAGLILNDSTSPENSDSFMRIYNEAAENTLKYLSSEESKFNAFIDDNPVCVSTDIFWKKYEPGMEKNKKNIGFGIYGSLAVRFGEDNIDETVNGIKYSISRTDYIKVYDYCLKKMVLDTLRCLQYTDTLLFPSYTFYRNKQAVVLQLDAYTQYA